MHSVMMGRSGFAMGYVLMAVFLMSGAIMVGAKNIDIVANLSKISNSSTIKNSMAVVRDFLIQNAADSDNDGHYELPKEAAVNTIPVSIPVNPADAYGTAYKYCTWDLGAANGNPSYSQNSAVPPVAGLIGRVISAGADKTIQTACTDVAAKGDDIVLDINESEVNYASASLGGWADHGNYMSLLNPADMVGIGTTGPVTHRVELPPGTTAAEGLALGDVEIFRSAAGTLQANVAGGALNINGGGLQVSGVAVVDSSRNVLGNNITVHGGTITMDNTTSNAIILGAAGVAPPSTAGRSVGTKLVLSPTVGGGNADYAFGVEAEALWQSVAGSGQSFKWYAGAANVMTLDGTGHLGIGVAPNASYSINAGAINATAYFVNGVAFSGNQAGTVAGQMSYWDGTKWTPTSGVTFNSGTGALNIAAGDLQIGGVSVVNASRNLAGINAIAQNLTPLASNTYSLGGGVGAQYLNIYGQNFYQNGSKVIDAGSLSGTANIMAKFTGPNAVGNSQIVDTGTNILIGTSIDAFGAKTYVDGTLVVGAAQGGNVPGVTLGRSGGDYGGIGFNYKPTAVSGIYNYLVADYASMLRFDSGGFKFRTAPIGAAGNTALFTDALAIQNNGYISSRSTAANSQFAFYNNANLRGYVYADTVSFGLLDNVGNWRIRVGDNGANAGYTYGGGEWWGTGGGYSGIAFRFANSAYAGTLMMNGGAGGGITGFYDENRSYWRWYVDPTGNMYSSGTLNAPGGIYGAVYN